MKEKEFEFTESNELKNFLDEMNQENYLRMSMFTNNIYIGIFHAQVKNICITGYDGGFDITVVSGRQHFIFNCTKITVYWW